MSEDHIAARDHALNASGESGGPISKETSTAIAMAWREIETAEGLLADIADTRSRHEAPDIRDAFGRRQDGLQLGVPSGQGSHRLFNVPWPLCKPIIEAHIAAQRSLISVLSAKAGIEMAVTVGASFASTTDANRAPGLTS